MAESSREVAKRIFEAADMDTITRIAPQMEDLMRSEDMELATAAMLVSSLVGWFVGTIDAEYRVQFEQCIEVQFEIASEVADG